MACQYQTDKVIVVQCVMVIWHTGKMDITSNGLRNRFAKRKKIRANVKNVVRAGIFARVVQVMIFEMGV